MFCCIGDLHLEALENHIPDAHKKVLSTYDRVVEKEIARGATTVIQLGDSFHSAYPDQEFITAYIRSLRKHKKTETHIIMGNHDYADVNNYSLKTIAYLCKIGFINGKVYKKPEVVKIDDEKYFFCPHPYVVDQPKGVRYSFGHYGYDGAKGDNGYSLKSKDAPRGRWLLGDYHTPQRGKNYMYAGSLCQVKWSESPEKAFIRLEETPKLISIEPDIKLGRASIEDASQLDELDPKIYWSINVSRKVKLPPDWAQRYPHISRHHTEKDTSKKARVLMKQVASEDPLEGLREYLMDQGLNDKEVKRGMVLLGRA